MRIIEDELNLSPDGSLTLSAEYLQEMGISIRNTVRVAFLSDNAGRNSYREFWIGDLGASEDEQASIQIPTELLQKAGLSFDEDLNIICLDGGILICRDTLLNEQELAAVMNAMDITADLFSNLPGDPNEAMQYLENAAQY